MSELYSLQEALYSSKNYNRRRLHRARLAWVLSAIRKFSSEVPVSAAIEYGPGSGVYLHGLVEAFSRVDAADIEMAYLKGISDKGLGRGVNLVVDDIQESKYQDNEFGFVLCTEVLEHVPSPELALKSLHRIMCDGGVAVITTPQRFSLMEMVSKIAFLPVFLPFVRMVYREPVLEMGHISLRSAGVFKRSLQESGFEILLSERFGLYIPFLAEFFGEKGGRAIAAIEKRLIGTWFEWMLWTQAYVVKKRS